MTIINDNFMFNIQLQHNNHNNHTQSTYHKQLNKHLHTRSNSLALNVNHYQTHMQTLSPKMGD